MINKKSCYLAISLWLAGNLLASFGQAATISEKRVDIELRNSGFVERTRLQVKLETAADLEDWTHHAVHLDDNRSLISLDAYSVDPEGRRSEVRRRDQDSVEIAAAGVLADSSRYHVVTFSKLRIGGTISIDQRVEVDSYYPATRVLLAAGADIETLSVDVRGANGLRRWQLSGLSDDLAESYETVESATGLELRGGPIPALEDDASSSQVPWLRLSWHAEPTWSGVAYWYDQIVAPVPRGGSEIEALTEKLVAGVETPRQRLEALVTHVRNLRYTAVEMGIGGYRPTPARETLDRGWGDCKDKSVLLIDLLEAAGIEAYPVLLRAGEDGYIEEDFPAPDRFNHLIAAVRAEGLETVSADPVVESSAGPLLFIDPTQERGSAGWLHPWVQDRFALVVRPDGGELLKTPVRSESENKHLQVDLRIDAAGAGQGVAQLELTGRLATPFLDLAASGTEQDLADSIRSVYGRLLPGFDIVRVAWQPIATDLPTVQLIAELEASNLLQGTPPRQAMKLAGLRAFPELSDIDDQPLATRIGVAATVWNLTLPQGSCPPHVADQQVANNLGLFTQELRHEGGVYQLTRRGWQTQRWLGTSSLADLRQLASAENKAHRRRIRLRCSDD